MPFNNLNNKAIDIVIKLDKINTPTTDLFIATKKSYKLSGYDFPTDANIFFFIDDELETTIYSDYNDYCDYKKDMLKNPLYIWFNNNGISYTAESYISINKNFSSLNEISKFFKQCPIIDKVYYVSKDKQNLIEII